MKYALNKVDFEINKFVGSATHKQTGVVVIFNADEKKAGEVRVMLPNWMVLSSIKEADETAVLWLKYCVPQRKRMSYREQDCGTILWQAYRFAKKRL